MKVIISWFSVLIIFAILQKVTTYNILFFHAIATSSHRTAIWPLAERLADLGHKITYIFAVGNEKRMGSHPNVEEIIPSKMVELNANFVGDFDINIRLENRVDEWLQGVFSLGVKICEAFYDSPETQEWLSRPDLHFDLVMIDAAFGQCAYGLVHKFKAKHIIFTPYVCGLVYDAYGVVPESSSIPDLFFQYKPNEMTVIDRMWNTIAPMMWRYNILDYIRKVDPLIREKMNESDIPSVIEFEKNTSLVFHNGYFIEGHAESLPPMFVSFSGIRCNQSRVAKPLPKDLAEFIRDAHEVVYVSLGSAVDVEKMPKWLLDGFVNAFRANPKVKFFWRWTGPFPKDIPGNLMLASWFPQLDILAHPKVKAFVTQAGRPSTQEALCYGIPLISIPVFADQDYNAIRFEMHGAGVRLNINTLTADDISNAVREVVYKPNHREAMLKLSKMYKDRPIHPLDNLVYWTEYALRYDTSIMQSLGMEQTWYQRRLIDVYAFIALVLLTVVGIIGLIGFIIIHKLYTMLNGNNAKKKID